MCISNLANSDAELRAHQENQKSRIPDKKFKSFQEIKR